MRDQTLVLLCALALTNAGTVRLRTRTNHEVYADPKQAATICAALDSDGILVAHEHCTQFYQCWDGSPVVRHCYGDLQYNPLTRICDWPHSVECGARIIPEDHEEHDAEKAPAICASEGSEQLLIAHSDCDKFYKCLEGRAVSYKCPGSLLYNVAVGYCDCASKVACGDRIITKPEEETGSGGSGDNGNDNPSEAPSICAADNSDGVLVAHEHCNKFYKCNHGEVIEFECFGGLLFNPANGHCDWSENVDCGDRTIPDNDSAENNKESESTEESGNDSDNGGSGTCNCNPGEAPSICSQDGSDGTLIAHENCCQFYQCVHGVPIAQTCPSGLLYNPYNEQCDWAHNVECGDRVIPEENSSENGGNGNGGGDNGGSDNGGSDSGSTENGGSDNGGSGTCNCNPGEAPSICSQDGSDGTLIAHENCNQFYQCVHGVPITQNCPSGLLYNPYNEQCDWAHNVECGDRVIPEENSSENGGNGNGGGDNGGSDNGGSDSGSTDNGGSDNGGSGTCNCNPGEAPSICSQDGSDGTLIAHENCGQFYQCVHGVPITQTCPSGLLYNPYNEQCDWAHNVECGDRVIPEENSSENGGNGNGGGDNGGGDNGGSDNGSTENGGSDNGGSGTCNCNPGEAPSICSQDGSDGTLIAHENCNQFYQCVHGVPITQNCPSGLLYNPYNEQCDWVHNVECGDRVIPEENSSENGGNGNGGGDNGGSDNGGSDSGSTDNGGSDNGGSGTCNCNPGEAPSICSQDGSDGTLIAHENCCQFYQCVHGVPITQTCPSGLLYNPYNEQCDWAHNVECGDRVIPEENSSENGGNGNGGGDNGGSDNGGSDSGSTEIGGSDNGGSGTCNCNPGEAPSICSQDGSDGTLIAHENCNQFYQCVHGVPITQNCPSGLLYNPYNEQCDWAHNVECGDRVIPEENSSENGGNGNGGGDNGGSDNGGSDSGSTENGGSDNGGSGTCNCNPGEAPSICSQDGSDGTLIAHENCNQFYQCVHGVPITQNCPSGLLYNPYNEQCDWAHNVECGDRVIPEENSSENGGNGNGGGDNGGSDNGGSDSGSTDNGGSDNGGSGTCNCNPGEAPSICSQDGSDGTLIAHENCGQFYQCVHGVPITQTCPSGLLYNPYNEQCDWAHNVECGDRVIPEENSSENGGNGNGGGDNGGGDNGGSDNGSTENGGSDNGGSGTCNCNPGEAPSICSQDGSDGTLIAHENCNQFYQCVHGVPITQNCPSGLLYNPYNEQCDWAHNVECGDRVIPEENSSENGGNGNGGGDNGGSDNGGSDSGSTDNGGSDNGGSGTCNCNPGEAPSICSQDGSDGTLIAHENCCQFYQCVHGVPITQTCPSGLLYNPYNEQCDWAHNVECGDRVIPEENSSENGGNGNGGGDNGGSDNGGSDSGSTEIGGSDNGGSGTCNCNPGEAPSICSQDGSDGTLIAHENCNQFYQCVHGVPITQNCPSGLLYNPYNEQCDWAHNVECGDRVIPEENSSENGGNGNGGGDNGGSDNGGSDSGSTENGGSDNGGSGTCNCNPGEAPSICSQDGSDGTLIAHENCGQFYQCVHGVPITQTCPSGLLYNPYNEQCDWAHNVECGDRVIPEENSSENGGNGNGGGDNGGSDNGGSDNGSTENGGSDNGGSSTCNCNPGEAPSICSQDGSDGTLIAHENCNQFYQCVHGVPITQNCPSGLLYNPYNEHCDWAHNVECGDRVIPEENSSENGGNGNGGDDNGGGDNGGSDSGSTDNGGSDNGGSGTCNCNPGEAPSICSQDGSDGTLIAHENCNQFYQCVHGVPIAQTCPSGLLYNPYNEQCDWAHNVECGDRVIPEENSSENGGNGNGGGDNGGGDNGGSDNGSTENGGSDNGGSGTCNCNPGEAPSICSQDGSDGTLIAHENCCQFYQCVHGVPIAQTCPSGLLYNPYNEQCDWAHNVECGDRVIPEENSSENGGNGNGGGDNGGGDNGGSDNGSTENGGSDNGGSGTCNCNPGEAPSICSQDGSDGTLIAHENCCQFYQCVHGVPITQTCPSGLLYNPYNEQCDWAHNVECGDRVIPEENSSENGGNGNGGGDNGGSDNGGSDSGSTENGGSDNGGSGTCNCNPGEAPSICSQDGSDGTLIAHENCCQFYQCVHGVPIAQTCPSGLLYNPYNEQCDWAHNVECGDRVIPEENSSENGGNGNGGGDNGGSDNGSTENGGSDNGGSGTCNCNPGEAPSICSQDGSDGTLIAHENCCQFYQCVHGVPIAQTCPSGLLYNPYNEQCDWAHNVECGDRVIPEENSSENGGNGNGGGDNGGSDNGSTENGGSDNGGSGTCNCNPGEAPSICSQDGSDGTLIAHENCCQFYQCVHGVPIAQTCPSGLLYNPYNEQCDWAHNVECGDRVIPEENSSENGGNGNGGGDNGGSDNGSTENGGSDNGGSGTCNCNPGEAPSICSQDGSDGTLIAHENCCQFYQCVHGVPIAQTCPSGLLYNPYNEQCDWAHNVECGDRVIPEENSSENGGNGNGGGDNGGSDNGSTENGGSDNGGSGTCNCNPGEAPSICSQDGSDGTLIAHENCCQFYQCVHGVPIAQTCPSGLLYNPYNEQCDWAHNVECGDRVIPEENSSENGGNGNGGGDNGGSDNGSTENGGSDNGGSGTCNCNPGEAPSICSQDGSDGTLIAHENCCQFYQCVHGVPIAQTCPSGLLYNPYNEQCDWAHNVECGDRVIPEENSSENGGNGNGGGDNGGSDNGSTENGGSDNGGSGTCNCNPGEAPSICSQDGSDGTLIAHENCCQFYQCVHGVPIAQTCPSGLLYNPYNEQCDWAHNVECGDRIIPEENSSENGGNGNGGGDNGGSDNSSTENGGSDNGGSGTCNCNPGEAPSICSQDGSDGSLIAHENCCQFYQCVHGVPIAQTCPSGLLYNPYNEQCDWAHNVECGDRVIPEENSSENGGNGNGGGDNGGSDNGGSDSGSTENGGSDNGGSGTCNCNPGEAPSICSQDGSQGTLIAHENCCKFYQCVHGVPVVQTCPSGLLYNPYKEHCDWADNVECGDRVIPEENSNENGGTEPGGSDNGSTENGGTDNGGTCNCNPGEAPSLCAKDGSDGKLIAHESCNKYYICVHGQPVAQQCQNGLLYNPYEERCDWASEVKCGDRVIPEECEDNNCESDDTDSVENNGSENESSVEDCYDDPNQATTICGRDGSEGIFVANENCNQFYVCVGGTPVTLDCPHNLLYDPAAKQCDWPENVHCGDRILPEEENKSNEDNGNGGSGTCNCNPGEAPTICVNKGSEGVLIAHENCNKFYQCDNGLPVVQHCPNGLLYNPYSEICDWPGNVKCGDRIVPEEDYEDDNNDSSSDYEETPSSEEKEQTNESHAVFVCSLTGSNNRVVPHDNCKNYYICVNGEPQVRSCSGQFLFNAHALLCDWPQNVDCGNRSL